jgi:hypothetical protein
MEQEGKEMSGITCESACKSVDNFVFTSAGDNTTFDSLWINDTLNYDIYVIYYGDNEDTFNQYKSKVKFIEKRKGSKFQNFKYFYDTYPDIINQYDRFFILDDDIIISVEDIKNMFKLSRQYNLDICAPSFSTNGYISHAITKHKPDTFLTYTNFVEVNTPLFSKKALDKLMNILDSSLIGWGIDFLFIWCNGIDKQTSYAIIHCIQCVNPHAHDKKVTERELHRVQDCMKRGQIWADFSNKINCPSSFPPIEYTSIKSSELIVNPWLLKNDTLMFYKYLDKATVYFEYGSGGSTYQANIRNNITKIYSVESDIEWLNKLKQQIGYNKVVYLYIEMDTRPNTWGYPGKNSTFTEWINYSNQLSNLRKDEQDQIDILFIDGRFRVACCLKSFSVISSDCVVVFDDFLNRSHYHVVLDYYDILEKTVDEQMVILKKKQNIISIPEDIIKKYEFISD